MLDSNNVVALFKIRHAIKIVSCFNRVGYKFPPQSEVQGQLRVDPPVVLNIGSDFRFAIIPRGIVLRTDRRALNHLRDSGQEIGQALKIPYRAAAELIKHVGLLSGYLNADLVTVLS